MKKGSPPSLDVSDATATVNDVLSAKTFYAGEDPEKKTGMITEATDLSSVDADLVTGNIKTGITIFGVLGSDDVQDVSEADAGVGDVKAGKTFFAVTGSKKTGTLPTETLSPVSETVAAGYYAATTLSAVDGDLITGSIKNGVTIFGIAGHTDVRDTSDADAAVGDVVTGKTFYAGGGAKKTGTLECQGNPDYDDKASTYTGCDVGSSSVSWKRTESLTSLQEKILSTITVTPEAGGTILAFAGGMVDSDSGNVGLRINCDGSMMTDPTAAYYCVSNSHAFNIVGKKEDCANQEYTITLVAKEGAGEGATFWHSGIGFAVVMIKPGA